MLKKNIIDDYDDLELEGGVSNTQNESVSMPPDSIFNDGNGLSDIFGKC